MNFVAVRALRLLKIVSLKTHRRLKVGFLIRSNLNSRVGCSKSPQKEEFGAQKNPTCFKNCDAHTQELVL